MSKNNNEDILPSNLISIYIKYVVSALKEIGVVFSEDSLDLYAIEALLEVEAKKGNHFVNNLLTEIRLIMNA